MSKCEADVDGEPCGKEKHIQPNGQIRALCKIHFMEKNQMRKRQLKLTLSMEHLKDKRAKEIDQDRKRRIRYVASRAATLAAIPVANVRRIAEQLDKIKSDQEYVIIGNVIEDTLDLLDVVTEGDIEPITFSEEAGPPLRTMQKVSNERDIIGDVLEAIEIVFPGCKTIGVKLLRSEKGNLAQKLHTDHVPDPKSSKRLKDLKVFHYSALIALMENTFLYVGSLDEKVRIPKSSMLFFRGDMVHAGSDFQIENYRLFISASSIDYPSTLDVSINYPLTEK